MNETTRSNLALGILWAAILVVTACFVVAGLKVLAEPVSKIIVAVLTGLFALIGAYITHVLMSQREREAEQRRRERDRYAEKLRRKEERYAAILEGLVPYIRSRAAAGDEFAKAVLHAYVVGGRDVASAVNRFLEQRTAERLDEIIRMMRMDLDMGWLDQNISTKGLLPPKEEGYLRSDS